MLFEYSAGFPQPGWTRVQFFPLAQLTHFGGHALPFLYGLKQHWQPHCQWCESASHFVLAQEQRGNRTAACYMKSKPGCNPAVGIPTGLAAVDTRYSLFVKAQWTRPTGYTQLGNIGDDVQGRGLNGCKTTNHSSNVWNIFICTDLRKCLHHAPRSSECCCVKISICRCMYFSNFACIMINHRSCLRPHQSSQRPGCSVFRTSRTCKHAFLRWLAHNIFFAHPLEESSGSVVSVRTLTIVFTSISLSQDPPSCPNGTNQLMSMPGWQRHGRLDSCHEKPECIFLIGFNMASFSDRVVVERL